MKINSLLSAVVVLSFAPFAAYAKIERVVEKTFSVAPGGTLRVETFGGSIRVQSSGDSGVKIVAKQKFRTDSDAAADDILKKLTLTLASEGANVLATASYEKSALGLSWGHPPVEVDFTIMVPARYSVDLKTSGGDIIVGDLDGQIAARTSGGDLKLGKISGAIDASTSGGDIELAEGRADTKLTTSGGNIVVGHLAGPTVLSTSGGNIKAARVEAALSAKTSGGDITAAFVGGLRGDSQLSTSGGKVRVGMPTTTGFRLDASTSGGEVKAEGLIITIEKGGVGKSRLSGTVNGGGPALKLHSSGGDIVIERR